MFKTLMIVNLDSGKKDFEKQLSFIIMELKSKEFDITIKYTEPELNAEQIILQNTIDYDLLIVCGGDGTVNQVVTALTKIHKRVSVAIIPTGTTNDFAKTLNLPKNGMEIAQNIMNSRAIQVDTGMFNKHYFNYVVAFGAFTEISYKTDKSNKKILGRFAYFLQAFKELKKLKTYRIKVFFDTEIIEDEYIYGSISNSLNIGGFKLFKSDEISLNDGKFEVLLVKKPKNIFGYFGIISAILKKDYSKNRNILFSQDASLKISSFEKIRWTIDGEDAGEYRNIDIGVINKNIEYLIM